MRHAGQSETHRHGVACAATAVVCLALLAGGCVAKHAGRTVDLGEAFRAAAASPRAQAAPAAKNAAARLEDLDPRLAVSLIALAADPSAESHRAAAAEYARLRVFDRAEEHLTHAIRLRSRDAAAFDARARVRRDSGWPGLAIGDAWRAWYYGRSAVTANTLGTVFEALGDLSEAHRWYGKALQLEPRAWFALNNVCHVETLLALPSAVTNCRKSLAAAPASHVARNNMALALASAGDFSRARESFSSSGTAATAAYNMGIVFMATRHFDRAVAELKIASAAEPGSRRIQARLAQASNALHP